MNARRISIDEHGRSCIVTVNGEYVEIGSYGDGLETRDEVELEDGSTWTVEEVYGHIQTGSSGSPNYVAVDLIRD